MIWSYSDADFSLNLSFLKGEYTGCEGSALVRVLIIFGPLAWEVEVVELAEAGFLEVLVLLTGGGRSSSTSSLEEEEERESKSS